MLYDKNILFNSEVTSKPSVMKTQKPKLTFYNIKVKDLQKYFEFEIIYEEEIFQDWFDFPYNLSEKEKVFLEALIQKHKLKLPSYSEEKLKMKFLSPILNKVDFYMGKIDDWYEVNLSHEFPNVLMSGVVDYAVAKGSKFPIKPYFFLQEFKPTFPDSDPELQLLAQMIVAVEENDMKSIKGGYIFGQSWRFAILKKAQSPQKGYLYYISPVLDSLVVSHLQQIYVSLQSVKNEILEKVK